MARGTDTSRDPARRPENWHPFAGGTRNYVVAPHGVVYGPHSPHALDVEPSSWSHDPRDMADEPTGYHWSVSAPSEAGKLRASAIAEGDVRTEQRARIAAEAMSRRLGSAGAGAGAGGEIARTKAGYTVTNGPRTVLFGDLKSARGYASGGAGSATRGT